MYATSAIRIWRWVGRAHTRILRASHTYYICYMRTARGPSAVKHKRHWWRAGYNIIIIIIIRRRYVCVCVCVCVCVYCVGETNFPRVCLYYIRGRCTLAKKRCLAWEGCGDIVIQCSRKGRVSRSDMARVYPVPILYAYISTFYEI
jgi:hypothetical protein